MATVVKTEVSPNTEDEILAALAENANGITNEELLKLTLTMDNVARRDAVNHLLATGKIEMLQNSSGAISLRLRKGSQVPGLSSEEHSVSIILFG